MPGDLYNRDFYLWTREQAEALRGLEPKSNIIDWDRLIEEVEGLGASQKNAVQSHLVQIIAHLYKLTFSRALDPRSHWRVEIHQHRLELDFLLTPAIRREVSDELDGLHRKGARLAQKSLDEHEKGVRVEDDRRWTLEQILGEADDPLAGD